MHFIVISAYFYAYYAILPKFSFCMLLNVNQDEVFDLVKRVKHFEYNYFVEFDDCRS